MSSEKKSLFNAILAANKKKKEMNRDEDGVPVVKSIEDAVLAVNDVLSMHRSMYKALYKLEALVPDEDRIDNTIKFEEFKALFLTGKKDGDIFNGIFTMSPASIALISLLDFFKDEKVYEIVDPAALPASSNLDGGYKAPKITHGTFDIGGQQVVAPIANEVWFKLKSTGTAFIVTYKPTQGGLSVAVYCDDEKWQESKDITKALKASILSSPYIKGQVLEISEGSDFKVVDIGEQQFPIISESLKNELEKNIINLFNKTDEFKKYDIPVKRSVIVWGDPGCGKTMISRWLASKVRGKVTTVWVTSKSIERASDIANIFEIARKLSPSLIIMEDLDLISGTRNHDIFGGSGIGHPLGEMLNQLDGLEKNDSIVLVGSTNRLNSLDEALKDRPGRFDRVYKVEKPTADLASQIATNYLLSKNITPALIEALSLKDVFKNQEFTGAQVVEVVKGAIYESIHRGGELNQLCIKASKDGLLKQRGNDK